MSGHSRWLILLLVSSLCGCAGGRSGMAARGPTLPGYARAAVELETNAGLRLPAVAQGGVQAVTVRPGALIVGVSPSAVATSAWGLGGGGGSKLKGKLTGRPTRIKPNDTAAAKKQTERENESARVLIQNGYDVEQNPAPRPNGKSPDYKVNGEYADCYAPISQAVRNVATGIEDKILENQASVIVVNLDDTGVSVAAVRAQVMTWPINGLEGLFVIKDGELFRLLP